jgi:hypothetical protein
MAVMGQTGRVVLSDTVLQFKSGRKKTVRYNYVRVENGWLAQVIGPFHSALYGTCSFATRKFRAKAALQRRLMNDYRYFGVLLFSDVDDADNVGRVDLRLWDQLTSGRPIIKGPGELIGSAGM